jgi:hypothetical protein
MRDDPFPPSNAEHAAPLNDFFRASFGPPANDADDKKRNDLIVEAAAMEFEPWHSVEGWEPPAGDNWHDHSQQFFLLRMAWKMVFRPKADLVKMVRLFWSEDENKDQELIKLIDGFRDADGYFQALHEIITTAQARLLTATSVVALEQLGGQADD